MVVQFRCSQCKWADRGEDSVKHVVIVGAGFAGLSCVRKIATRGIVMS